MTRPRYTVRMLLLTLAILAGMALDHGQKHRLAEAEESSTLGQVLDG